MKLVLSLMTLASFLAVAVQSQSCGPIAIAGASSVERLALAWADAYGDAVCPPQASNAISVDGGGSSSGAARVCGTSANAPVDIGGMTRTFNTGEASTSNNWEFECERSTRKVVQVKHKEYNN
jgi:ABC-type phosphate transport system substrate-binding protein